MNLKLDENLGHAPAGILQQAGHEVETVRTQGLSAAADEVVIAVCQREKRCLVTLDAGFGNPLVFKPREYSGIAVLRLPAESSPEDLLMVCRTLIRALEQDNISGKLWSVQRGRIREYRPDVPEEEHDNG